MRGTELHTHNPHLLMKRTLLASLLLVLSLIAFGAQAQKMETLKAQDYLKKMEQLPSAQVLDIRTPEELKTGMIAKAKNINFYDKLFAEKVSKLDKAKPIMVYCAGGGRSAKAMQMLNKMGFKEVYNLEGGMSAWNAAGLGATSTGKEMAK